jgi:hypothetical protein
VTGLTTGTRNPEGRLIYTKYGIIYFMGLRVTADDDDDDDDDYIFNCNWFDTRWQ